MLSNMNPFTWCLIGVVVPFFVDAFLLSNMNPFTWYLIGVVVTFFVGAFLRGFIGKTKNIEDIDDIGFLGFCAVFWPITVPLFGFPTVIYLFFCAVYDLGHYLGKKLSGEK